MCRRTQYLFFFSKEQESVMLRENPVMRLFPFLNDAETAAQCEVLKAGSNRGKLALPRSGARAREHVEMSRHHGGGWADFLDWLGAALLARIGAGPCEPDTAAMAVPGVGERRELQQTPTVESHALPRETIPQSISCTAHRLHLSIFLYLACA
jgi:hypothetical protein